MKHPESFRDGQFRVVCLLGEGGMALVYFAVEEPLSRAVAIKVPRPNLVGKEKVIGRFAQETVTMARAAHPNVVTLHAAGAERLPDGTITPYLVMELFRGVSVEDMVIARKKGALGKLPPGLAARIVLDVLSAVATLHADGLIHRDIKPANVMVGWKWDAVNRKPIVKLMDFGIARIVQDAFDDADRATKTQVAMFSLGYSAPEQQVSAKGADARADLYAVGAMLYAMLTGVEPSDLHNQSLTDEEFLLVPEALRAVVFGATRYKPADRAYKSAVEMADAILSVADPTSREGEEAFCLWLAEREKVSPVEAALLRAFGHGYTIVPEAAESVTAGYTRWYTELEAPKPVAEPDPVPPARRKPWGWIAGGSVAALASVLLAVSVFRPAPPEEVAAPAETKPSGAVTVSVAPTPEPAVPDPVPAPEAKAEVPQSTRDKRPAKVADAAPKPVPAPVVQDPVVPPPEPVLPRGTVRLGGGATSLSLVASDGTVHPAGRVPPGTYRLQAVFPEKGIAPNAGTLTVGDGQTVTVVCQEMFKLCGAQ